MAAIKDEEAYEERDETIDAKGNVIEVEIPYLVFNANDESKALSAVRANRHCGKRAYYTIIPRFLHRFANADG